MKKVILTGASGHVGTHALAPLLKTGCEIHAVYSKNAPNAEPGIVSHQVDLLNPVEVHRLFEEVKADSLIHLAWYVGPGYNTHLVNIDWTIATLDMMRMFVEFGGKRAVMTGSVAEYDSDYGVYCTENITPTTPPTLYGRCKNGLGNILCSYAEKTGVSFAWARLFPSYGPLEQRNRLTAAVINDILDGVDVKVSTALKFQDTIFVQDLADGVVKLFESDVCGPVNIATGMAVQAREVISTIAEIMDFKGNILWGAYPSDFRGPYTVASIDRMVREVGWSPKVSLREGLKKTIEWWTAQRNKTR